MTERDDQVLLEIFRSEIRWYHFVTPEARNIVTDRVRTDVVRKLADAGRVDIGMAEPGSYSVPILIRGDDEHFAGEAPCCAERPVSTSPEPGPEPEFGRPTASDTALVAAATGGGIASAELLPEYESEPGPDGQVAP